MKILDFIIKWLEQYRHGYYHYSTPTAPRPKVKEVDLSKWL